MGLDFYQFYLNYILFLKLDVVILLENFFWKEIMEYFDYDEFWQKCNIVQYFKNICFVVMIVGGWFDVEDLYGFLMIYGNIEKWNNDIYNIIVMGFWSYGDWL